MNDQHKQIIAEFKAFLESHHLLEAYIANTRKYSLDRLHGAAPFLSADEIVGGAFEWGKTPQGLSLWGDLSDEWGDRAEHPPFPDEGLTINELLDGLRGRLMWTEQL